MATFNADNLNQADQLRPPADYAPDPTESTPPPAPTDAERAELAAKVKGTAITDDPDVTTSTSEAKVGEATGEPRTQVAEIVDAEPVEETGNAVALVERFDIASTEEVWPYDFLEFKGDKLGIRLPTRQALAAFSLASSKYVSLGVKNDLTGLFIARHLSPESYGRVFSRLMDPDEADYDVDTVGELFNAIVTASIEADKADAEKGNDPQ